MFVRVEIRAEDLAASQRFYATVLGAVPIAATERDADGRGIAWRDFAVVQSDAAHPATRGLHLGFAVPDRAAVDAFWEAGVGAGYRDDGPPGPRPQYVHDYYGAFLLDPDGNSAEAVHYGEVRAEGAVDHLWIRVADLAAARDWYAALAPTAGWRVRDSGGRRAHVERADGDGSFALVADERPATQHAHVAVAAPDPASAGVRRDPDGNRVELV